MKHKRVDRLDLFPYPVIMTETHVRAEHIEWLEQHIPNGYETRWTFGGPKQINFSSEHDKMLFVLRWS